MEGRANLQLPCPPGAILLGNSHQGGHSLLFTGDHHLAGTIVIGWLHHARGFPAQFFYLLSGQAKDRRHATNSLRNSLLHITAPAGHQTDSHLKIQHARSHQCAVFTQAQTRGSYRDNTHLGLHQCCYSTTHGQNCRLGVLCHGQVLGRPLKTQLTQGKPQGLICPLKIFPHQGELIIQLLTHARVLSPLAGKNKGYFFHYSIPPRSLILCRASLNKSSIMSAAGSILFTIPATSPASTLPASTSPSIAAAWYFPAPSFSSSCGETPAFSWLVNSRQNLLRRQRTG